MGGSAGRADAAVGAVEAQKAEGVLHLHLYIFLQSAHQFCTLFEIADMLRNRVLTVDAFKNYINSTRVGAYPDIDKVMETREQVEKAWPAYSKDQSLARMPKFFWTEQLASGEVWKNMYEQRLQHSLSCMNHHIHPVVNEKT